MKLNRFFILLSLGMTPFFSFSQKGRLNYANKMFNQHAYYLASGGYEDVLERTNDSAGIAPNLAYSYDQIGNIDKAIAWYSFLKRNHSIRSQQSIRLIQLERELGHYNYANQLIDEHLSQFGDNDILNNIKTGDFNKLKENKGDFKIHQEAENSPYSDVVGGYLKEDSALIVVSARRTNNAVETISGWSGDNFYRLFSSTINQGGNLEKFKLLDIDFKSTFHEGPIVINHQKGFAYFTMSNQDKTTKLVNLKLYRAKIKDGVLSDAQELSINSNSFSNEHPALSKDGQTLYFASNRPNGFGGADLYSVSLNENGMSVGDPVNLGSKVNTSGDEVFPFVNTDQNILFFSSDGLFGLGGLDVFYARINKSGKVISVDNIGSPINSSYDDFAFINNQKQTDGFFTSNRPGGSGKDDIYSFDQKQAIINGFVIDGQVANLLTGEQLGEAKLIIKNAENQLIDSTISAVNGNYSFTIPAVQGEYVITTSKNDFVAQDFRLILTEDKQSTQKNLQLMPILNYVFSGNITDKDSHQPLDNVRLTFTNNDSKKELTTVTTDASGNFLSAVLPNKYQDKADYSLKIEKDGYVAKTIPVKVTMGTKSNISLNDILSKNDVSLTKIVVGKTDLNDVVDIKPIYFDLGKSNIRPDAAIELDKVVELMKENPKMVIELGAHTDSRGSAAFNLKLSDKRAKSSARYIISKGIDKSRIYGKGYGMSRPVVSDAEIAKAKTQEEKEALYQKNRRTEFIIVKMK